MRVFFLIATIFISFYSKGQLYSNPLMEETPMDSLPSSTNFHSSIKPYLNIKRGGKSSGYTLINNSKLLTRIEPIVDLLGGFNASSSFRSGFGFNIESDHSQKVFYRVSSVGGVYNSNSKFITPHSFFNDSSGSMNYYGDIRARIVYQPNHIFNFHSGIDHNFIGEGSRSLFLSDYGVSAPFFQIRTNFWNIDYDVIYHLFREADSNGNWHSKYAVSHYLSYNIFRWLNIGLFENVLFAPQDKGLNRGFESEYLNPIIFYRPQEYALGSSDNSFLGGQLSVKYKNQTLYGQLAFDDFVLSEFRARTNWWGNKYAYQLGIKGYFKANGFNWFYRIENNYVRPYTFSHIDFSQNYANQGSVLAHPLGANFNELLVELKLSKNHFHLKSFVNYYLKGYDKGDSLSYGGEIYKPYDDRPYEYGVILGQGNKLNVLHFNLSLAYDLKFFQNFQVFVENHMFYIDQNQQTTMNIVVGFRNRLWNNYRNY